jgi:UDP-3-O-[3-hydroxymyristoyl] N-acetylglucosamine deacetylase
VFLLQSAGIAEQNAAKRFIRIREPVEVRDGDKWARFAARRLQGQLRDRFRSSGASQAPPAARASMDFSTTAFLREISRARTFGFMRDIEFLRSRTWAAAAASTTRSCSTSTAC